MSDSVEEMLKRALNRMFWTGAITALVISTTVHLVVGLLSHC